MKIYTKKGDNGETYCGNSMISKSDLLVEVVGDLDELNSLVGICKTSMKEKESYIVLESIQSDLLKIGAEIGYPSSKIRLNDKKVKTLENIIDTLEEELPELKDFILPGGSFLSSNLHLCRSVCRRTERRIVKLSELVLIRDLILAYINRLSDLFFVYARYFSKDRVWNKNYELKFGGK